MRVRVPRSLRAEEPAGADTTARHPCGVNAGDREAVRVTAEVRLRALVDLRGRLAPSSLGAVA